MDNLKKEMAERNLILKVRTGSYLYGTNTPTSDVDYIGVFIPDKKYVLGLHQVEQVNMSTSSDKKKNTKDDIDYNIYSLPKFIKLLIKNNPNIIELLFAPDDCIVVNTAYWTMLRDKYRLFVSKNAYKSFTGYAFNQSKKLKNSKDKIVQSGFVEKYNYDVKLVSHLIRLLSECLELLTTGKLSFPLNNSAYLKSIRLGEVSLMDVLEEEDRLTALIEQVKEDTDLRDVPDLEKIESLQMGMLSKFWGKE